MLEQGIQVDTPVIMQDNASTIALVNGNAGKYRTKHLRVRQAHLHELTQDGACVLEHLSTSLMLADPLSKPLQGSLFRFLTSGTFGETPDWSDAAGSRRACKTD